MKHWLGIGPQLPRELAADFTREALKKLELAQAAHISDLRVLIDKGLEREAQLSHMVQMVVEERCYRPAITAPPASNRPTPAVAVEHLNDVAVFDEATDAAQIAEHDARSAELDAELAALRDEQNQEGLHQVA